MQDQDPNARSRDRTDTGSRPDTGFASIADGRTGQSRDPLRTVSRAELTEYKETAARGTRARTTAADTQGASVSRDQRTRDGGTRGGQKTRDSGTRGMTSQTRLPDITRQGRSQPAPGSRQTTVPRLPPISEPTSSEVDDDEGYHGYQESVKPETTQTEKDARREVAEKAKYQSFKMTERVQQGKLYDPGMQ